MYHDEVLDCDDGHMHQHINANDSIVKQVEQHDVLEVIKYVNLLIKTKKTWQMHDA